MPFGGGRELGNKVSSHSFPLTEPKSAWKAEGLMWSMKVNLLAHSREEWEDKDLEDKGKILSPRSS